jgi:hypothetical protein
MTTIKELSLPNFAGVCLQILYRAGDVLDSAWMEEVRFEVQADRIFLVGKLIDEVYEPGTHIPIMQAALAWDAVVHYFVFRDRFTAIAYYEQSRDQEEPRKGWFR